VGHDFFRFECFGDTSLALVLNLITFGFDQMEIATKVFRQFVGNGDLQKEAKGHLRPLFGNFLSLKNNGFGLLGLSIGRITHVLCQMVHCDPGQREQNAEKNFRETQVFFNFDSKNDNFFGNRRKVNYFWPSFGQEIPSIFGFPVFSVDPFKYPFLSIQTDPRLGVLLRITR